MHDPKCNKKVPSKAFIMFIDVTFSCQEGHPLQQPFLLKIDLLMSYLSSFRPIPGLQIGFVYLSTAWVPDFCHSLQGKRCKILLFWIIIMVIMCEVMCWRQNVGIVMLYPVQLVAQSNFVKNAVIGLWIRAEIKLNKNTLGQCNYFFTTLFGGGAHFHQPSLHL